MGKKGEGRRREEEVEGEREEMERERKEDGERKRKNALVTIIFFLGIHNSHKLGFSIFSPKLTEGLVGSDA